MWSRGNCEYLYILLPANCSTIRFNSCAYVCLDSEPAFHFPVLGPYWKREKLWLESGEMQTKWKETTHWCSWGENEHTHMHTHKGSTRKSRSKTYHLNKTALILDGLWCDAKAGQGDSWSAAWVAIFFHITRMRRQSLILSRTNQAVIRFCCMIQGCWASIVCRDEPQTRDGPGPERGWIRVTSIIKLSNLPTLHCWEIKCVMCVCVSIHTHTHTQSLPLSLSKTDSQTGTETHKISMVLKT